MVDSDGRTDGVHSRRKRGIEIGCHIVTLLVGTMYLLVFAMVLRTGYLSWIGILIGILLTAPTVISPILGLAGWRRLSTVLTWVGTGVPILAALVMQASLMRAHRDQGDWRPYRFDDELAAIEAKRAVPDAENAAHRYESLFADMDLTEEPNFISNGDIFRDEIKKRPWERADYPQVSAWLDSHSELTDELMAIGEMGKCRWPVQADRFDEYTVPCDKLRHCVLLLMAAGNQDLGEGRVTEALEKYLCAVRIGNHVHQQPSEVDLVAGLSYERGGLEMLRYVLVQSDLLDEQIGRIADCLPPAADLWAEEWARLREFEKLQYMNLLGRLYEVDTAGKVQFARALVMSPKDERERNWFPRAYWFLSMPRDPHRVRRIAERYFGQVDRDVGLGRLQSPGGERDDHASLNDLLKVVCNPHRWAIELWFFNASEYAEHRRRYIPCITVRRGTWLVLGLRRYRASHGVWPRVLDEVSPYVPPEAFSDPTTGGAFVYAPEGDNFRLYSKGLNHIDEDGRNGYVRALDRSEDDIPLWPPLPAREPEPYDEESDRKALEAIYGKDYVEMLMRSDPNDRH
ncbi:MAG: hypothetical protein ABFE13_28020 [Phycisphaerales bacterium]